MWCFISDFRYLGATIVADRNYPQGSVIPCGQPVSEPPPPPPPPLLPPPLSAHFVTRCPPQFAKSWVVANTGTKKWKHVTLVHQAGYAPVNTVVEVPDLRPEEQTILTVEYPPVGASQQNQIANTNIAR